MIWIWIQYTTRREQALTTLRNEVNNYIVKLFNAKMLLGELLD